MLEQQQLWHLDCQLWRSWAIYSIAKTLGLSDILTTKSRNITAGFDISGIVRTYRLKIRLAASLNKMPQSAVGAHRIPKRC